MHILYQLVKKNQNNLEYQKLFNNIFKILNYYPASLKKILMPVIIFKNLKNLTLLMCFVFLDFSTLISFFFLQCFVFR